jgi:hypothetical protein
MAAVASEIKQHDLAGRAAAERVRAIGSGILIKSPGVVGHGWPNERPVTKDVDGLQDSFASRVPAHSNGSNGKGR